jgi:hypothetical protein
MKIKLGLLKQIINEESQKLNEAAPNATHKDVKQVQRAINIVLNKDLLMKARVGTKLAAPEVMQTIYSSPLKPDGDFGPNTEKHVRKVQGMLGEDTDGVVGRLTAAKMEDEIREIIRLLVNAPVETAIKNYAEKNVYPTIKKIQVEGMIVGRPRRGRKRRKPPEEQKPSMAIGGKDDKPEGPASIEAEMYDDVDRSGGPVKRRGPTGAGYLEEEGIRAKVTEKIKAAGQKAKRNPLFFVHVLGTLKDDDGIKGKRMSELKAALVDLVERRGKTLEGHYNRLMKVYRGRIKATDPKNRDEYKSLLSDRIREKAKQAQARLKISV